MTIPSRLLDQAADDFELDALRSALNDRGSEQACRRALGAFSGVAGASLAVPIAKASGAVLALKGVGAVVVVGVCCLVATSAIDRHGATVTSESAAKPALVTKTSTPGVAAAPLSILPVRSTEQPLLGADLSQTLGGPVAKEPRTKQENFGVRSAVQTSGNSSKAPVISESPSQNRTTYVASFAALNEPPSAAAPPPIESPLAYEIGLLDLARRNLAQGNAAAALAALERRQLEIPSGTLGPEATVLRVEALLLRGDRNAASALATRFLGHNPGGPHAVRLRRLLGDTIP